MKKIRKKLHPQSDETKVEAAEVEGGRAGGGEGRGGRPRHPVAL